MSRWLAAALLCEGPTDVRFFSVLLPRLLTDILHQHGKTPVEIGSLDLLPFASKLTNDALMAETAKRCGSIDLLFLHADEDNDSPRVRSSIVEPRIQAVRLAGAGGGVRGIVPVPVVPVRAMEAWCLVDGNALRRVTGATVSDQELNLPASPMAVERIADPKASLQSAFDRLLPSTRGRKRVSPKSYFDLLGEALALERLRKVPAFQVLETDLFTALSQLGYLRSGTA